VDNGNPQGAPLTALLARYPCDTGVTLWPFRHLCAAVAEAVWMMCAWISHFCHAPINGPKLKTRELHMYVYRIPRDLPRLNATNMQAAGNAPPARSIPFQDGTQKVNVPPSDAASAGLESPMHTCCSALPKIGKL
jgi:hypothetical protein